MARFLRTDTNSSGGHSKLFNELVEPAKPPGPLAPPIATKLTDIEDRGAHNLRQRAPHSDLRPPAVVGAGISYGGPGVRLVEPLSARQIVTRKATSKLYEPAVVGGIYELGPGVVRPRVTNVNLVRRAPKSELRRPTVVTSTFVALPIAVHLADTTDRAAHNQRQRQAHSKLRPPAVVGAGIRFGGPRVLTVAAPAALRRAPKSRLRPAAVASSTFIATPLAVTLVSRDMRRVRRRPWYDLRPPVVVGDPIAFYGPGVVRPRVTNVNLVRRAPKSRLAPPTATASARIYYGPQAHLAYSRRGRPLPRLFAPAVVGPVLARPIEATLARIKPVRTVTDLRAPVVVVAPALARPITTKFAPQRRGKTITIFNGPRFVFTNATFLQGPMVQLAPSHRLSRIAHLHGLGAPFVVNAVPALGGIGVQLAYSLRGRPKSKLPVSIVATVFYAQPITTTLAPQTRTKTISVLGPPRVLFANRSYALGPTVQLSPSSRGVPKSRLFPPTVTSVAVAYYGPQAHLAYSRRGKPKSFLLRVPAAFLPFPGVEPKLAPSKRGKAKPRLFPPTVVGPVLARPIDVTFAPQKRGVPKSVLRPAIIPPLAPPVEERLAVQLTRAELERHTISRLGKPVVVDAFRIPVVSVHLTRIRPVRTNPELRPPTVIDLSPQAYYLTVTLAPSKRGTPKSKLNPAIIPPTAPPVAEELAVQLVRARLERRLATYRLSPPTVIDNRPQTYYPTVWLTYSLRGKAKSELRGPTDLVDQQDLGFVRAHLAYSLRGRPVSHLSEPTVIGPVLAHSIKTTFVRIRPAHTITELRAPVVVYTAVELSGPELTLAPSFRGIPKSRLFPPTDLIDRQDIGAVAVHLAPSRRGTPKPKLAAPAVIDTRPQTFYLNVSLAYSVRGVPKPQLFPPPEIQDQPKAETNIAVTLAYSLRGTPKSRINPPTVVTTATPYLRAIETKLVRIRPVRTLALLGRPTDTVGIEDQGSVAVTLAESFRGRPKSKLSAPTVVAPVLARGITVTFAPQKRGAPKSVLRPPVIPPLAPPVEERLAVQLTRVELERHTISRLGEPVVVDGFRIPFVATYLVRIRPVHTNAELRPPTVIDNSPQVFYLSLELAPSFHGQPKSHLFPPVIPPVAPPIDAEIAVQLTEASLIRRASNWKLSSPTVVFTAVELSGPEITLAPSFRGTPKSFLSPPVPAETFPPVHEEIAVQLALAEVRQRKTISHLEPPTVVFTAVELSGPETALAPSSRGKAKPFLRPMGGPAVVYAPLEVKLAPSTKLPRAQRSRLSPPTVIDNRPQTYYLTVALAYSLRGKAKPFLFPPPKIQATAKAETVLVVTLAYSLRGTPKFFLRPPTVVTAATPYLRPIDVSLVRIRPVKTIAILGRPVDTVGLEDQGSVQITLTASFRGRPKSRLTPPTVVFAFIARPIDVELTYSRHGRPLSHLSKPTVVFPFFARAIDTSLARIRPVAMHSVLREPTDTTGLEDQGRIETSFARIRPAAVHSILREPVVVRTAVEIYGPEQALAPSFRGQPKPKLTPPTVVYTATEIYGPTIKLAPSKFGHPRSSLFPPTVVAEFIARPTEVALTRIKHAPVQSRLAPMVFAAPAPAEERFEVTTALAEARRPKFRSFLPQVVYEARTYAPITVALAPQPKPKTLSLLFQPLVGRAPFRAIQVNLTRIVHAPVKSQLFPPAVIDNRPQTYYLEVTLAQIRPVPVYPKLSLTKIITPPFVAPPLVVHLAPSTRGAPQFFYSHPTTLVFVPPRGDICGYDTTPTEICGDEQTTTLVFGGDQTENAVTGSDRTGTSIDGTDSTPNNITGFDQKAT